MAAPLPIDFARSRPATPLASWALCAVAAVAATWAAVDAVRQVQAIERQQAQAGQLAAEIARREARPAPTARRSAVTPGPDRRQASGRQQAADSLGLPWIELLDRVEGASSAQVVLRQLRVEARFDRAHVDVAAPTLAALFDFERQLGEAGDPIRGAQLASHEWAGQGAARQLQGRIVLQLRAPAATVAAPPVPGQAPPPRRALAALETTP